MKPMEGRWEPEEGKEDDPGIGPSLEEEEDKEKIEEVEEMMEDKDQDEDEVTREDPQRGGKVMEERPKNKPPKEDEVEEKEKPQIKVIRVGIPIIGTIELFLQLRADGFYVYTVHTDCGRNFVNKRFKG